MDRKFFCWPDWTKADRKEGVPSKPLRFSVLLGGLIAIAVAVNALIIVADSRYGPRRLATQDCSALTENAYGGTCSDRLARRPSDDL